MKNFQPTKIKINNPVKPVNYSKQQWQTGLRILIQSRLQNRVVTEDEDLVELDDLDKIEILMDFEEIYHIYHIRGKINDDEFVKCKSFCNMLNYLSKFIEVEYKC